MIPLGLIALLQSRMLSANILGEEHYNTARAVQKVLQVRHCATRDI